LVVDKTSGIQNAIGNVKGTQPSNIPDNSVSKPGATKGATDFSDLLTKKLGEPEKNQKPLSKTEGLRFSQHALERMANRGITFKPEDIARLNDAVDKAAKKGSRESLVLMGENAFIVSVKSKTVVTAMDREAMKENVFTNIDSTVIL